MLRTHLATLLVVTASALVAAQTQPLPQTARQALLEMFTSTSSNAFERHLPEAARHALIHNSDSEQTSMMRQFSSIARELGAHGQHVQTFDSGQLLLSVEDPKKPRDDSNHR